MPELAKHLVVVASDAKTGELIRQELNQLSEKRKTQTQGPQGGRKHEQPRIGTLTVDVDTDTSDTERSALIEKVKQKQLDAVLFATNDALAARKVTLWTRDVASIIAMSEIEDSLNEAVRRDLLRSKGMSDDEIDRAMQRVSLDTEWRPQQDSNLRTRLRRPLSQPRNLRG